MPDNEAKENIKKDKKSIGEHVKIFSGRLTIVFLILLFFVIYLFNSIVITVYPGEAGVLFKRLFGKGTVTSRVYPEGINFIFPWDIMYRYDTRVRELKQDVDVLSTNGLTIKVVVSVRFHIVYEDAGLLHQLVGPDYVRKIIIPSTISSVREVVGKYRPEQLYTTARHVIQDEVLVEAIEETGRVPIIYDDMIIESLKLPVVINDAIEAKLRQQQQYLEYEFRIDKAKQEAIRKRIEATGIRDFQNTVAESLTPDLLTWRGIDATLKLSKSNNAKIVIVGGGKDGLPVILNADSPISSLENESKPADGSTENAEIMETPPIKDPNDGVMSIDETVPDMRKTNETSMREIQSDASPNENVSSENDTYGGNIYGTSNDGG